MARFKFQPGTFTSGLGRIVVGGTVTVYLAGTTTLATVYAAETGSAITGSTITTDSAGVFEFWVDTDDYVNTQRFKITLVNTGFITQTYDDIDIFLGLYPSVETVTATTTLTAASSDIIICTPDASDITITLPAISATSHQVFTFICQPVIDTGDTEAMSMNPVAINTAGSDVFKGSGGESVTQYVLTKHNGIVRIYNDGTNWTVLSGTAFMPGTVITLPPVWDGSTTTHPLALSPSGEIIDTGSSTTSGLQEAIDYAENHGYDMHFSGGNARGEIDGANRESAAVVYYCTSSVVFPPMQGKKISSGAITFQFASGVANSGIFFDSMMMVDVDFAGAQVVYPGSGHAVQFKPTNPVPLDAITTIVSNKIFIQSIVNTNTSLPGGENSTINFDLSNGPITANEFKFIEVNGFGGTQFTKRGILINNLTFQFATNTIYAPLIHRHVLTGILAGTAATTKIYRNTWIVAVTPIGDDSNDPQGILTFGSGDTWICHVDDGVLDGDANMADALRCGGGADNNNFIVGECDGDITFSGDDNTMTIGSLKSGSTITDNSTNKRNRVDYRHARVHSAISVGSSPFDYQNDSGVPITVTVAAGTISQIAYSPDNSTFYNTDTTSGKFDLEPGEALKVTYSSLPTMRLFK